ncbi:hypothetical protein [Streptomyces sp. WMMB 322]|uniref:hypothetical protein n=1 Tax=Streptomyces sp. WMMB 322 TaxID=1286821 RepID=UPI0006E42E77|nr:hypothetical protein [Streptomyces sp. WMMB 322]SCK06219.1 hypothetical protein H180DRAFT_00154 [Streptomyces sp. WMMB 322]
MSSSSARPADDLKVRTVAWAVAAQVWPLLAFVGVLWAAALVWMARSGDSVPATMAWVLLVKPAALGLVAAFALHESAHVVVLKRIGTVTHIAVERTVLRTSVVPEGTMTARQAAAVALSGPSACFAVGAVLWLSGLDRSLSWWYLAHIVFLLPFFGDGRALRQSLRADGKAADGR